MAKKKRRAPKEEEEKYEFVPPEFDEKEFLLKDIQVTKVLWVVTALAIIMGFFAYFFSEMAGEMVVGLLILMVSLIGMKQILALFRFDVSEIENKSMIGNYILFFFLFLGIWIICMNPPLADHTNPVIGDMNVTYEVSGEYMDASLSSNIYSISGNGTIAVNISTLAADNTALSGVTIMWKAYDQTEFTAYDMTAIGDNHYQFNVNVTAPVSGTVNSNYFKIVVTDNAGHTTDTGNMVLKVSYAA
ncbi:MAG: hypothetical protein AB7E27_02050 [Candidatus Methanomethylophilaceae archaeon]